MFRLFVVFLLCAATGPAWGRGSGVDLPLERSGRDAKRERAVKAGLDYLVRTQSRDGAWGRQEKGIVGITSLCLLAFFSAGAQMERGEYADVVSRGISFLKQRVTERNKGYRNRGQLDKYPVGYIVEGNDPDSRMHGHGYATQALLLAYSTVSKDKRLRADLKKKIRLAIRVIENSQTTTGGWGYQPHRRGFHEGSVTVCVVQALRLAADAGFIVDKEVHKAGLKYLHESQKDNGSFRYSITQERSSAALTAAALCAMHGFGEYYSEPTRRGLEYLRERFTRIRNDLDWPFYCYYYAAQVFYRVGGPDWRKWLDKVVYRRGTGIVDSQERRGQYRGSWTNRHSVTGPMGRAYATAYSVLALSVSDGYSPLFQK